MTNKNDDNKRSDQRADSQHEEGGRSDDQTGSSPEQRREALRKILAGGGIVIGSESLPTNWSRPVVDSIFVPAHALTSLVDPCALNVTVTSTGVNVVVSGLISPPTGGVQVQILVELLSGAVVVDSEATTATSNASGQYTSSTISLTGSGTSVRATTNIDGVDQAVCQQPLATTTTSTTSTTPTTFTSTTTSFFGA